MTERIDELFEGVKSIGIAGHVRPDGDCVGSNLALCLYLKTWYPQIETDLYLEPVLPCFTFLDGTGEIKSAVRDPERVYDLFIVCDVSAQGRIAVAGELFAGAKRTVCIDHHVSNKGFASESIVSPDTSSASEVLYELMDPEKVTLPVAEAIYTGIVHDTRVFQYPETTPRTLRICADLMEKGVRFTKIIEETYFQKTYVQNQVMGRVLAESIMMMDGQVIVGYMKKKDMDFYGVKPIDLDGIVAQMQLTAGISVAIFLYELENQYFKVSLRSMSGVDVSRVAVYFGGGGHVGAAGCEMAGSVYDVINNLTARLQLQMTEYCE